MHVRAARALLAWSQQDLAKQAGVATSTVADFERGQRRPVANNAQAIRGALEKAGARFLAAGAVIGEPPPRLAPPEGAGTPIRWVNATDLEGWAERRDGVATLPVLLTKLVHATHGAAAYSRFPSDEGGHQSGWDGVTRHDNASRYVPQGAAGWEIKAKRRDISGEATEDYNKRTADPADIDPATSTFIFVTPRHWAQKHKWEAARRKERRWKDVRAYDGDDLVHWIELNPAVGQWLATVLGKRPAETRQLDEIWEEWSSATEFPLTLDLVLSDRDEEATAVLRWLRSRPSVHAITAETSEEGAAFFFAALQQLPSNVLTQYLARCLVAATAEAARMIADAPPPMIIVLLDPDPGLARQIAKKGHFVLLVLDGATASPGETRALPRPSRAGIERALVGAGIAEARARTLARDSGRSLAILRRLIPTTPGRLPEWARGAPPPSLLAAMLAGSWDDAAEADRRTMTTLAGRAHDSFQRELAPYVGPFDSPLRRIGTTWRMASPRDAWMLLARYLTVADIERFEAVATEVLGAADPRHGMEPDERWQAELKGVRPAFSDLLRHGVGEILILLALRGDQIPMVSAARRRAEAIVSRLLHGADPRRWWSLSRSFQLLAEASPTAFLDAVEHSLQQTDPPIRVLFGTDRGPLFGAEYLSDLLWALESLAWSPDHLARVCLILARLDAIDLEGPASRFGNRPANSLRQIHLLWSPQTNATLDQRLRVLDQLRDAENQAAWRLMLGILPGDHDSFSHSPPARWRDFQVDDRETATKALIEKGARAVSERLLRDAGTNATRWARLLDQLCYIWPGPVVVMEQLAAVEAEIHEAADREALWAKIRGILHDHRQMPAAHWAAPPDALDRLERIHDRLAPLDVVRRFAWLFATSVELPNPKPEGWNSEDNEIDAARTLAIKAVFEDAGIDGMFRLAQAAPEPGYLGKALAAANLDDSLVDAIIERSLTSHDNRHHRMAHGLVIALIEDRGEPWAAALVARARDGGWGDEALMTILGAMPRRLWTWEQARALGAPLEDEYWRRFTARWIDGADADLEFAVRKLVSVGRARHALSLAGRDRRRALTSATLIDVLEQASRPPSDAPEDPDGPVMFRHYVADLLTRLDERPDVSEDAILALEWAYLPLLERSERPAKVLKKRLATEPALFVELLRAVYRASADSDVIEEPSDDVARASAIARQGYRLLRCWDQIPGARDDGSIDGDALETWIKDVRASARAIGRAEVADFEIGDILSASPKGADGRWPAEAVRKAIDRARSDELERGLVTGRLNRWGATGRLVGDGGQRERDLAATYRDWARALAFDFARTSKVLSGLADHYDEEARRADERADRLDWS
jgi:transcriptional regulator with XRE-family HTH domain